MIGGHVVQDIGWLSSRSAAARGVASRTLLQALACQRAWAWVFPFVVAHMCWLYALGASLFCKTQPHAVLRSRGVPLA